MANLFVGDKGFSFDFPSQVDLTAMDEVRLLISKPFNSVIHYDFLPSEFNTVGVGDTLSYTVRDGDFDAAGVYNIQVVARNSLSDVAFEVFSTVVEPRLAPDVWGL